MNLSKLWACGILIGVLALTRATVAQSDLRGGVKPPTLDMVTLEQLTPDERFAIALGALQWRDERLSNISYELVVHNAFRREDGSHSALTLTDHIRLDRIGDAYRLRTRLFREDGSIWGEPDTWWDGSKARTLAPRPANGGKPELRAGIIDREPESIHTKAYNELLGFRQVNPLRSRPVSAFFAGTDKAARAGDTRFHASADVFRDDEGRAWLVMKAKAGYHDYRFFLDPARGFLISRSESDYRKDQTRLQVAFDVVEARQVNGLWVPFEVTRRVKQGDPSAWITLEAFKVTRFEVGNVQPADLEVNFPAGTTVNDEVERSFYTILPDGGRQAVPWYDAASGKVQYPATTQATTRPAAGPSSTSK